MWNKESRLRGARACSDALLGSTIEAGRIFTPRCRFPSSKPSLVGHHKPLTRAERLRFELWCNSAD